MQYIRAYLKTFFSDHINSTWLANALVVVIMVVLWMILGFVIIKLLKWGLKKALSPRNKLPHQNKTLIMLINNVVNIIFWFYIVMMIFKELGQDLTPILASAGVLAFAVGFGAQELIKDLISGVFLILEKAIELDHVIQIGAFRGKIIEIGLRRTKIMNWKNEILYVNNGDIRQFISYNEGNSVAVVDLTVAHDADLDIFLSEKMDVCFDILMANNQSILTKPKYMGVAELKETSSLIRFSAETKNNENFAVERYLRAGLLQFCNENQIQASSFHLLAKKEN